jgi:hypothetical protein
MNTKSVALIAVFTAFTITLNLIFPILMLFVFLLISMVIKPKEGILLGIVVGLTSYLISGQILALTNVFLLPMIVIILHQFEPFIYKKHLSEGCHRDDWPSRLRLFLVVFGLVLVANFISEVFAAIMINGGIAYIIASLPIILLGALANATLIGVWGIYLQLRLQKLIQ